MIASDPFWVVFLPIYGCFGWVSSRLLPCGRVMDESPRSVHLSRWAATSQLPGRHRINAGAVHSIWWNVSDLPESDFTETH